jgi:hypothetical protein
MYLSDQFNFKKYIFYSTKIICFDDGFNLKQDKIPIVSVKYQLI